MSRNLTQITFIIIFVLGIFTAYQGDSFAFLSKVFKKKGPSPAELANYETVTWDFLGSFMYATSELEIELMGERFDSIPDDVQALDGQKVAVDGFMIPLSMPDKKDNLTDFVLVRDQMSCCFGTIPKIVHWMIVRMDDGRKAKYSGFAPIKVFGTLEVGEKETEDGTRSLYRMKGYHVEISEDVPFNLFMFPEAGEEELEFGEKEVEEGARSLYQIQEDNVEVSENAKL